MKNVLMIIALLVVGSTTIYAQTVLDKAKQTQQLPSVLPISDVAGTANGILSALKPKLALSDSQNPKILGALTEFLQSKSGILGLAKTDPAEYGSKFGGIKDKLFSSLKTLLTAAQYAKLLGLKPKASDAGNVLSHLFF